MNYPDDTFLARWLAGTLNEEEKAAFEQSDDFKKLNLFLDTLGQAQSHPFDHESALAQIKEKQSAHLDTPATKTRSIRPLWYLAAAAVAALLVFLFWPSSNATISIQEFATVAGEQRELELTDSTLMQLNAVSKARVEIAADLSSRKVFLEGEAYFDVRKKGAFAVSTELGLVEVLGTRFSVRERENGLDVQCFEGSVSVSLGAKAKIDTLRAGEGIRMDSDGTISRLDLGDIMSEPSWTKGITTLVNLPLRQIIKEYERIFNTTIKIDPSLDTERKFTISFPNEDLRTALMIGLNSFGMEFTNENDSTVKIISK
ncbi:MAG: FecR domain-containing protein [Bacteroidota bacterium]